MMTNRDAVVSFLPAMFDMLVFRARDMIRKNKRSPMLTAVWLDVDGSIKDAGFFSASDLTADEIDTQVRQGLESGVEGSGHGPADVMACLSFDGVNIECTGGILVSMRTQDLSLDQFVQSTRVTSVGGVHLDMELARPYSPVLSGRPN